VVIDLLIRVLNFLTALLVLLVILNSVLSFFVDFYHPVRQGIERIVGPLLNPIRRVVPLIGMFDISPLVLILIIYAVEGAIVNLLNTLR
jgi:YggT family protein